LYIQFGTEAFHSHSNVTFQVRDFDVAVARNLTQVLPKEDPNVGTKCAGPGMGLLLGSTFGMMLHGVADGMGLW
jgi:hypothetical protein